MSKQFERMQKLAGLVNEDASFQKPSEDSDIESLQSRYKSLDNPEDLEIIAQKQNPRLFKLFEPGFNAKEIQLGDYIQFFSDEKPDLVFSANEKSVSVAHDNIEYVEYSRSRLQKLYAEGYYK